MHSPIPDYLARILAACDRGDAGALADYIPELAAVDPDRRAVALCMPDGTIHAAGDADAEFTIQSMSKPFAYAMALCDRGLDPVLAKVGVEPSGEAFNDISTEPGSGRPLNPMINIGAITTHSLVGREGSTPAERDARLGEGLSAFAGRDLRIDEVVCDSEFGTAYRNLALAALVRASGIVDEEPETLLAGYTRQCSYRVTTRDLAVMAMTLAGGGVNPVTGEWVVPSWVARQVLSVMTTCGMYDAAGDWLSSVGIPAKSGVSGGVFGALPGQIGIGSFSPRLDRHGHSVTGVAVFQRLSQDAGMHLMEAPPSIEEVARSLVLVEAPEWVDAPTAWRMRLQGPLTFIRTELVVRRLGEEVPDDGVPLLVSLERVTSVGEAGRRMLLEALRRLSAEGHAVYLYDPFSRLPQPDLGDGSHPVEASTDQG